MSTLLRVTMSDQLDLPVRQAGESTQTCSIKDVMLRGMELISPMNVILKSKYYLRTLFKRMLESLHSVHIPSSQTCTSL